MHWICWRQRCTPWLVTARGDIGDTDTPWPIYRAGRLREVCFQLRPSVVRLVFKAAERAAVDADLDALPMMKAGSPGRQVVGLGPWLPLQASLFDKALMGRS